MSNESYLEENQQESQSGKKGTIARAAAGGLAGAAIGYMSSEENRKKITNSLSKENLKEKGNKLGTATKDQVSKLKDAGKEKSGEAVDKIKSTTSQLISNGSSKTDQSDEDLDDTSLDNGEAEGTAGNFEELKQENEQLSDRLQGLEEKMDKLLEISIGSNEEDEEEEGSSGNSNKKSSAGKKSSGKSSSSKKKSSGSKKNNQKKDNEEETSLTIEDDTSA